jgi:class 3 adenylate cyclase/tetratricopeptide (TPR) repeat protein
MDVGEWLRNLGLSQYDAAFRESELDADVLPELTDQHLKDLGIPLGHRLKMLRAIRELSGDSRSPSGSGSETQPAVGESAERRQLTVMFCDLVGSTALSARLDPEDMRGIITAYHRRCAAEFTRSGGYVAKYMGDGVLAYFGYPQAHEHDAERAVQAALAITETVPKLDTVAGSPLRVRVGIATGIVVVGDLIGSGEAQERGIVGDTPNLAARLQGIAEPDRVVIADGTRRLVGDLFELEDLGFLDLKGIAAPSRAWVALRTNPIESRFEALHTSGLTSLVGREEEIALLLRRWSQAKGGEGQVVLISGEAGIGKSRLTAALLERLAGEPHTRLRYFCSPQRIDSALFPIISQLERAAGLLRDDSPEAKLNKLAAILAQTSTSANEAALFVEMLSLTNDGRYPALAWTPEQRRQKSLDALLGQTRALARSNPVLAIFEDAHWADPTSLEVLGQLVAQIPALPVLLLITYRPEFQAPWIGQPQATSLIINRLTQRDVVAMIDRVAGNRLISANVRQDIIDRTDGIPLFVEEVAKAILEAESEGELRRTVAAVPIASLSVPASLHASLMARLDRLGAAKEVAQIGAAIGREFSHALLASVASKAEADLGTALDRLIGAGLLFRQGVTPNVSYLFKHALVQDAAYGTLLREPRRSLHARIANAIELQFPDASENQPELLARHCAEALQIEKAAELCGKAALQSLARSALVEAAAQFERAIALVSALPSSAVVRRNQVRLQLGLANALMQVKGYAAAETKAALHQARELIEQSEARGEPPDDPMQLLMVAHGIWAAAYLAYSGDALRVAQEFMDLAQKQGTSAPLVVAHRCLGTALTYAGRIVEARQQHDRAFSLHDPVAHRQLPALFGTSSKLSLHSFRALPLWLLGYPEAARGDIESALKEARATGQAAYLMLVLGLTNYTNLLLRDYVIAKSFADELDLLAVEKAAPMRKGEAMFHQGCLLAETSRSPEAVAMIAAGIAGWRATGATLWQPLHMSLLANAHAKLGQFDEAWRCIREALAASESSKEVWCDANIHRIAGETALLSNRSKEAEAHFEQALEVSRQQQAKSFELRAAMSLARLWSGQGKSEEAHDLLAPVFAWFTEGFDTPDLRDAKSLLNELAS